MDAKEKKQITDALALLRNICNENQGKDCTACPLGSLTGCKLKDNPIMWILASEKKEIWHAFK